MKQANICLIHFYKRIWCTWSLRALLWSTSSRVSRAERTYTPGDRWEVLTFWPAGWLARVDLVRRTTWGLWWSLVVVEVTFSDIVIGTHWSILWYQNV